MLAAYKKAQQKFWEKVRENAAAKSWFQSNGLWFDEAASGAPYIDVFGGLNRTRTLEQELRVSLDHILEKAEHPALALDATNLRFTMQWDNWLLKQLGDLLKTLPVH